MIVVGAALLILLVARCAPQMKGIPKDGTPSRSPSADTVKTYHTQALKFFLNGENYSMQGDYAMAILEYQDALLYDSTAATIYSSLGKAYLQIGKVQRGIQSFEKAVALDDSDIELNEILAQVYFLSGKVEKAERLYEKLIRQTDDPSVVYQLAAVYLKTRKTDRALQLYEDLFRRRPEEIDAIRKASEVALLERDLKKAIYFFDILIENEPDSLNYLKTRAELAVIENDWSTAVGVYRQLLILQPQDMALRIRLAEIYAQGDPSEEADNYLQALWRQYPDHPEVITSRVIYLTFNQRAEEALAILDSAAQRLGALTPALRLIKANALNRLKRYTETAELLVELLATEPDNYQARHLLANVYDSMQDYFRCDSLYETILNDRPDDIVALNNYAYSLAVRGEQLERALAMVTRALAQDPDNASYLDTKGWVLFRLGQLKEARQYVEKSAAQDNQNAEVLEHLGDIHKALRDVERARRYYRQALELDPTNPVLQRKAAE